MPQRYFFRMDLLARVKDAVACSARLDASQNVARVREKVLFWDLTETEKDRLNPSALCQFT